MEFLKNNQKLRIIPGKIKGICNGIIKETYPEYFTVQLANVNESLSELQDSIEVIIPTDTCLVRFETRITRLENNIAYFSMPQEFKCVQRREYTRVNISIPVKLNKLEIPDDSLDSVTENLSAGGMQIVSAKDFDTGTLLEAKFSIVGKKDIKTILEVLRKNGYNQNNKEYMISGYFKTISNADRTAIIQLCFKRQLEIKCKEVKSK